MSIPSIPSSGALGQAVRHFQVRAQSIQNEFQRLGQDLEAGNLTKAQGDFSVLSQNVSSPLQSNTALAQAFNSLGTALQAGNLPAAQQAYASLQADVQQPGSGHHQHRHHGGTSSGSVNSSTGGSLSDLFSSLGTALQAGNLSAAQTAYATLSQGFQQISLGAGTAVPLAAMAVSFLG